MDLRAEQLAIYQAVKRTAPRSFVRICKEDCALWVSDLPRHTDEMPPLANTDVRCWVAPEKQLLYLDWTEDGWACRMRTLPDTLPAFPVQETLHTAYALCRFLAAHPAERTAAHLPFLRRMIKALHEGKPKISLWHEQAAQALRCGTPLAGDAWRLLSAWIAEQEEQE